MKKILITGISGFAGSFLAEFLVKKNSYKIFGTSLTDDSINISSIKNKLQIIKVNLLEAAAVTDLIKEIRPDYIYHLAALSAPVLSFKNPAETITNNVTAEVTILEALKKENLLSTRTLIVSSADVYGVVTSQDLPIDENTPFNPTNPYSVSKIAQDYLGLQYYLTYKMPIVRVRPFNHIGPRQAPNFVVPDFARQIAEIEVGKREPIMRVGNLEAKRDFTDVRDMVRAYEMIIERGVMGEVYNVGSEKSYSINRILDMLLSYSTKKIRVEKDPNLIRPSDNPELLCDASKIKQVTNWQCEISLEKTLKDTLDYWRSIVVK